MKAISFGTSLTCAIALLLAGCGGDAPPSDSDAGDAPAKAMAFDACAVVTQGDATALFGEEAVHQEGQGFQPSMMLGECMWTWDTDTANQLLQFRVWDTEQGYSRPEDEFTQTFAIGDRGHVRMHPLAGVDVEWVQDNRTVGLSYSKVGGELPDAATKADALKSLASRVAGQL